MNAKLHIGFDTVGTQQVAIFINTWYYLVSNYLIPPPLTLDGSALGSCLDQSWPQCQSLRLLVVLPSCFCFETWSSALLPMGLSVGAQSSTVILTQANKPPSLYCLDFQVSPVLDFQALSLTSWDVPGTWS